MRGIIRDIKAAIRDFKAAVRRAVNTALVIIFLVVGGSALIEIWPEISERIGEDCGTELCCQECTSVSVTRIIDGDTFVSADERVRLFGADTPERGERCFDEATERLCDLASRAVRVEIGPRTRDRYGRRLRYIYTRAGDSVEKLLVREGLARESGGRGAPERDRLPVVTARFQLWLG